MVDSPAFKSVTSGVKQRLSGEFADILQSHYGWLNRNISAGKSRISRSI